MIFIFLVLCAVVWIFIAGMIAWVLAKLFPRKIQVTVAVLTYFFLLPLPLLDEIVARTQFERLCQSHLTIKVDSVRAEGKKVYLADLPDVQVPGQWVHVVSQPWRFADVFTNEEILSYDTFVASGGFFVRRILGGGAPLLFKGSCGPGGSIDQLLRDLKLTQIQRSKLAAVREAN